MMKMFASLLSAGVLLVGAAHISAQEAKVGDKLPEFTLKGSDGKTYSSKKILEKQPMVIAWFPKAFTGG